MKRFLVLSLMILAGVVSARAQAPQTTKVLPMGATVFIAPMDNGFDTYLKAAIEAKHVPVTLVRDRSQAKFEISGHADSTKASTAKKAIQLNFHSSEQASIQVANIETGTVVFAYSVNKSSSAHGKQSTAEACAKHLKDKIDSRK
jgi:hypothetical protein